VRVAKTFVLHFPPSLINKPIIYRLVKDYDLEFNILKASVSPNEEGRLVMALSGERKKQDEAVNFLKEAGVNIQPLEKDITRLETRCTHCGVCVTVCPTNAFAIDPTTRRIVFTGDKCIACELCLPSCPVRAMEMRL